MDFDFRSFAPPAALKPVLRSSFYARGRISYRSDKILPNGLVVALFFLGAPHRLGKAADPGNNPVYAHSCLHGVQTSPVYNTPSAETHVLGLLFEPIGFHALFLTDMERLVDVTVDARDVLPLRLIDFIDDVKSRANSMAAHGALHQFLLKEPKQTPPDWLQGLYSAIKVSQGMLPLAGAYDDIGLSARHINARFKASVGVSPKVLCRIYRLEALLEGIDPSSVNWADLAHRFGYFDQAHFNREFRLFSGLSPSAYLEQRRRDLPDLAKGESVHFAPQR